jgi:hypothetical protein
MERMTQSWKMALSRGNSPFAQKWRFWTEEVIEHFDSPFFRGVAYWAIKSCLAQRICLWRNGKENQNRARRFRAITKIVKIFEMCDRMSNNGMINCSKVSTSLCFVLETYFEGIPIRPTEFSGIGAGFDQLLNSLKLCHRVQFESHSPQMQAPMK